MGCGNLKQQAPDTVEPVEKNHIEQGIQGLSPDYVDPKSPMSKLN